ncbi:MAG: hypothetical protein ACPLW7_01270 [Minisyncoccia bacterium]|uniref:hypothetical protein n=1 Tax=Caldisericum exile TaxID=693075 RepID=UPI003C7759CC
MRKVKFFLVVTFLATFLTNIALAEKIKIIKENGGENGYRYVEENHSDPLIGEKKHTLICRDPGYQTCAWTHPPSVMRLIDYAEDQITKGILNGQYEKFFDNVLHRVVWSATDIYNVDIEETIFNNQ